MARVKEDGQLLLDQPLEIAEASLVKVIVLVSEDTEFDPDETPTEEIKESLRQALKEAKEEKRIPLSQMWDGIDVE